MGLLESAVSKRNELRNKLNEIKKMEVADVIQKSKVTWAIEGDENSAFFHGVINKKTFSFSYPWSV